MASSAATRRIASVERLPSRRRLTLETVLKYAFLLLFAALCLFPLLLVISTALKDPREAASTDPFALFTSINLDNFARAWNLGRFGQYFFNTVLIAVPTVIGAVALSILAGYALARFEFPGRSLVFYFFVLGLMIPFFSIMIPLYFILRGMPGPSEAGYMLGTQWAVILPSIAGVNGAGIPLGVFMMRAFFADMPRELSEAAKVDGATEWGVFWHVMLPLAAPGAGALAIFAFLSGWNQFLLPLLYLQDQDKFTLAQGLLIFASGRTQSRELVAAGSLIMIIPIVVFFLLFQRQFVRGLTAGAVRG